MVTLAALPAAKAQTLKKLLLKEHITALSEDILLPENTSALSVRVKVAAHELELALPVLDEFMRLGVRDGQADPEINRQVFVPVDFSEHSMKAAIIGFELAGRLNARMVLFHSYPGFTAYTAPFSEVYAIDPELMAHLENDENSARNNMESFLKKLVTHFPKESWGRVDTEFILKAGDPRDDILTYAEYGNVTLIVMGTQGKAKKEYEIIGSVAAAVITSTRAPVLAVPAETSTPGSADFKKILYATNFHDKDFIAIDRLMDVTGPASTEVFCVHVSPGEKEDIWDTARLKGMKEVLSAKYPGKRFDCRLIPGEDFLVELEKFVAANDIDLVAFTTFKRNLIERFTNPSITKKALMQIRIPIFVFHA